MTSTVLRPALTGVYTTVGLIVGALFALLVAAGFFFGTALAVVGGALGAGTVMNTSRQVPKRIKSPGRDEIKAALAAIAVVAITLPVALLVEGYAWIGMPIGGLALVWMLYAYSHPDYSPLNKSVERQEPVVTPASDLRVGLLEMLKSVDIFEGLSEQDLRRLTELGAVRTVRTGEGLGAEGQIGQSIYVILEGQAHLSANSSIGRLTARMAGPGESFPLAALLGDGRLITTVKASTDMKVWQVDRSELINHFDRHPAVAREVYERAAAILGERYRSTISRLTHATSHVVEGDEFWANV